MQKLHDLPVQVMLIEFYRYWHGSLLDMVKAFEEAAMVQVMLGWGGWLGSWT